MGSTNFLPFNPGQANQENDAAYLVDATRTGGAGVDAIWPSPSANKSLYQACGGVYALMQMMANKGFVCSDANLATLSGVLANILTTADVQGGLQTVAWASTLVFNAAKYSGFQVTLTGNTTVSVTGQIGGELIGLLWLQDGVGGRTVSFAGNIKGATQPDPAANVLTVQLFKVDAAGNLNAVGPAISVNGAFFPALLSAGSFTLAGGAPVGDALVGNGTIFVPQPVFTLGGALTLGNVVLGFAAGSGASAIINGNDGNHQIEIIPGSGAGAGTLFTVNFTASRGHTTYPIIQVSGGAVPPSFAIASSSSSAYSLGINGAMSSSTTWNVICP